MCRASLYIFQNALVTIVDGTDCLSQSDEENDQKDFKGKWFLSHGTTFIRCMNFESVTFLGYITDSESWKEVHDI